MRRTRNVDRFTRSQGLALDASRNIVVRANAGSGKTSVLVERIIQILAHKIMKDGRRLELPSILAITFTRKAAAKLQEELIKAFETLAAAANQLERDYWLRQIDLVPHAMIGTIDSFCARVVREFALIDKSADRVEPDFEPLEGYETQVLRREAVDRVIGRLNNLKGHETTEQERAAVEACCWWAVQQSYYGLTKNLVRLLDHMTEPAAIIKAHQDLPSVSDRVQALWKLIPAVQELAKQRTSLSETLLALSQAIEDLGSKSNAMLQNIRDAVPDIVSKLRAAGSATDQEVLCWLGKTFFREDKKPRIQGLASATGIVHPLQDTWGPLLEEFEFDYEAELTAMEAGDKLVTLLEPVYQEYLSLCRSAGRYDFLTIERRARHLLAGFPEVKKAVRNRYAYVLVDEFQDTNYLQWEIISYLVGAGPDGPLDADRLFIVGDPQQSIYRFRNAEVGVFKHVSRLIEEANRQNQALDRRGWYEEYKLGCPASEAERLGQITLHENFRSLAPIPLLLIDRVFQYSFGSVAPQDLERYPFEIKYETLKPSPKPKAGAGEVRYVYPMIVEAESEPEEPAEEVSQYGEIIWEDLPLAQVKAVVDQLQELHGQVKYTAEAGEKATLSWSDMAILLPSRDVILNRLERVLEERHIPFVVTGGIGFWQRQEICDVINAASFLSDTGDEMALFGVARGPIGQLEDAEILFLSQLGFGRIYRGARLVLKAGDTWLSASAEEWHQEFAEHWSALDEAVRQALSLFRNRLSLPAKKRLRDFAKRLDAWIGRVDRMTHSDLLQRVLEESGAYAIYAAEESGERVLANLRLLFDRIHGREEASPTVLAGLSRWLRQHMGEFFREEQAALPSNRNAVQIMTVHAAKGLEFPVVAVMKMDRQVNAGGRAWLMVQTKWDRLLAEDEGRFPFHREGSLAVRIRHPRRPRERYTPVFLKALHQLDRRQELAESRRLFYVAATRAKERLILAGKPTKRTVENWQSWLDAALVITDEHRARGLWQEGDLSLCIITQLQEPMATEKKEKTTLPASIHLGYLHEQSSRPALGATSFEPRREALAQDPREWWLRYRYNVDAHVKRVATSELSRSEKNDDAIEIGSIVGTTIHRLFELGPEVLQQKSPERRTLIEAVASSILSAWGDSGDLASGIPTKIIFAVEGTLQKLARAGTEAQTIRKLLESEGEVEVPFVLRVGGWQINGRFDKLVPTENKGYAVVDWKTDADDDMAAIIERYRTQMKLYALALLRTGRATGPIEVHLVLLHHLRVETVRFPSSQLDELEQELKNTLKEFDFSLQADIS
jgi:ATP-dependent helicase/nuclease subunit A